jgi:hypothetical protein
MNKSKSDKENVITTSGNVMAISGGVVMGASAFAALISGAVFSENLPYSAHLYSDDAEKIANSIATKMGYETNLITDSSPLHKNAKYLLTPYDSLYYDCTGGRLPTDNSFEWKQNSNSHYYSRSPESNYHAPDYTISSKDYIDPSKQDIVKDFNAQYKSAVKSATYDPGNSHAADNCTKALIIIGIVFSAALVITLVGCCLDDCCKVKNEEDAKNAPPNKQKKSKYSDEGLKPIVFNQDKQRHVNNANKEVEGYQPPAYNN